jgi:hypothetical protein
MKIETKGTKQKRVQNAGSCKTMQDCTVECTLWMMDFGYQYTVGLYDRLYDAGE